MGTPAGFNEHLPRLIISLVRTMHASCYLRKPADFPRTRVTSAAQYFLSVLIIVVKAHESALTDLVFGGKSCLLLRLSTIKKEYGVKCPAYSHFKELWAYMGMHLANNELINMRKTVGMRQV
uniref:Secreted protein n=1 Tax=Steinernema glaseri TaxID=37863 RepID=A0A1I7ZZB2_9BILA